MRNHFLILSLIGSTLLLGGTHHAYAQPGLTYINGLDLTIGNAEIIDFTTDGNIVASSGSNKVQLLTLNANGSLTPLGQADFSGMFGGTINAISSVALDPNHRGFGAAALIPSANATTPGKVGFFNYTTGATLATFDVGFHPDSVHFSPDGTKLLVVNEGERTVGGNADAPGSLSVIDLSAVTGVGETNLASVNTYDFQAANLGLGVSIDNLRYNDTFTAGNAFRHVEPEFVSDPVGSSVFVTLQENNAIAAFDLNTNKWSAIYELGTIEQTIDASDKDGLAINDQIKGMPMPDTIVSFNINGVPYLATVNEGDFRGDDNDRIRIEDIDRSMIDDSTEAILDGLYSGDFQTQGALGRLRVSKIDGDTDNDNQYEEFIMPGTRSISIWNALTGELVGDTGSLEAFLATEDPTLHNINAEDGAGTFDDRSDDKGPEPEAMTIFTYQGRTYVLAGMERQNGLVLIDVTDPANPTPLSGDGYINSIGLNHVAPESIIYISATDSPLGVPTALVGYEVSNSIGVYSVPEPTSLGLIALGSLALLRRRR